MDLDVADEAPAASTSRAAVIEQEKGSGAVNATIEDSKTSSSRSSGVLLFPFEAEGDSLAKAATAG